MRILFLCSAVITGVLTSCQPSLHGQRTTVSTDVGVTYVAGRSLKASTGESFWMQGGSIELGANAWKGLGVAAKITGSHTSSIGSSAIPLSLVTITFGPRYRWGADHRLSLYGEGLVGEANGFYSLFPLPGKADTSANSLATQVGGGADVRIGHGLAVRICEVSWLRTQLPNGSGNVQNSLNVGAGVVLRFGR